MIKHVAGRDRSHVDMTESMYMVMKCNSYRQPNFTKYKVSRTGYNEVDLTDNKSFKYKIDLSLHVRPFGDERLEVIVQSKFGYGNTVLSRANRYYLNVFYAAA
jgi:hypothetical protein